jgi:cytochrome c oxidase subunit III
MNGARPRIIWPWQVRTPEIPDGAGTLGLSLFFVSLGMLFLASMVGVLVVRLTAPEGALRVGFPAIGWASTGALAAVSLSMHCGVRAIQSDRKRPFQAWMIGALASAFAFLLLQSVFWSQLLGQDLAVEKAVESGLYAFLLLTSLHAAHVVGGVVMQALVTVRALRNDYWSLHCGQVRGTALYWHFIDVVWVALMAFLLAIR